jgi:hypothetical protein
MFNSVFFLRPAPNFRAAPSEIVFMNTSIKNDL